MKKKPLFVSFFNVPRYEGRGNLCYSCVVHGMTAPAMLKCPPDIHSIHTSPIILKRTIGYYHRRF